MASFSFDLERAWYGPVGHCIYCKETNSPLSSEHVFPFFLGGNIELEGSSCAECAKITSYLDGYCAHRVFHIFRAQKGIQTRRPKNRPAHFPVIFETDAGNVTRDVPIQDHPLFLLLPRFEMPGVLVNRAASEVLTPKTMELCITRELAQLTERMRQPGDQKWSIQSEIDFIVFSRFRAKTALAAAVAFLGYDSSQSPLRDLILGKHKHADFLIGCEDAGPKEVTVRDIPNDLEKEKHAAKFQYWGASNKPTLLSCGIQFLVERKMPEYIVIVGNAPSLPVEALVRSPSRKG